MLARILEPEVMDTPAEAVDYDSMDHSEVNRAFVDDFLAAPAGRQLPELVLDAGTGTALIPVELCRRAAFTGTVTAIDLASEMLKLAGRNVESAGVQERIRLERVDGKSLPYADGSFDAVMSNSIVHHIPRPIEVLREMVRVLRPGGVLFVRDLMRPADEATLNGLVQTYAGDANEHQQQMFRDSLHAALTLEELRRLLAELDIPPAWAAVTTDRHWTVSGRVE